MNRTERIALVWGTLFIALISAASVAAGPQTPDTQKMTIKSTNDTLSVNDTWKKKLTGSVNLTQAGYSNWAKGGENTVAWSMRLDGDAKRDSGKWQWHFTNIMLFGQTKQEGEDIRNTLDKIDVDGTVTCTTHRYVNPFFCVGLLTQFARSYDYKTVPFELKSAFWDPAFVTQSIGARVQMKQVSSQIGMGFKQTMTRKITQHSDDPRTDKVEKYKFETGITSKTHVNAKLNKTFSLRSKLELFSSFEDLDIVDMNWDTLLTAKLNKYIVVTLNVLLNYDKDVLDRLQFKEITALGLSYSFI